MVTAVQHALERAAMKRGFTILEAAQYTGLGQTLLRQLVREGTLRHSRVGKRIVLSRESLDRLIDGC